MSEPSTAIEKVSYSHDKKDFDLADRLFSYREDGVLVRKVATGPARVGDIAGTDNGFGYCRLNFNGKLRLRSHLVWLLHYGVWPTKTLDHINGVRWDDRISNLREVSLEENLHNKRAANRNNRLGVRGVVKRGRLFAAYIVLNGAQTCLGTFPTSAEASVVYEEARSKLHSGYVVEAV